MNDGKKCTNDNETPYADDIWKNNDIIELILNLKVNTLSFKTNEKDFGIAFNVQHKKYKVGVTFTFNGGSIQFISGKKYV